VWLVSGLLGQSLPQGRVTVLVILGWVVAILVAAAFALSLDRRPTVAEVSLVMLVFLQSWRAAVIPLIAVPVAIIGTFAVMAGMGLSFIGMIFAALGFIPPVAGALLQEVIDVAVILNALRALRA